MGSAPIHIVLSQLQAAINLLLYPMWVHCGILGSVCQMWLLVGYDRSKHKQLRLSSDLWLPHLSVLASCSVSMASSQVQSQSPSGVPEGLILGPLLFDQYNIILTGSGEKAHFAQEWNFQQKQLSNFTTPLVFVHDFESVSYASKSICIWKHYDSSFK